MPREHRSTARYLTIEARVQASVIAALRSF